MTPASSREGVRGGPRGVKGPVLSELHGVEMWNPILYRDLEDLLGSSLRVGVLRGSFTPMTTPCSKRNNPFPTLVFIRDESSRDPGT